MTDHKTKMLEALEAAERATFTNVRHDFLLEAQVHAAAYSAEEQRLANRIAYVALLDGQYRDARADTDGWDWESYLPSAERRERVQELIREGLGLA